MSTVLASISRAVLMFGRFETLYQKHLSGVAQAVKYSRPTR